MQASRGFTRVGLCALTVVTFLILGSPHLIANSVEGAGYRLSSFNVPGADLTVLQGINDRGRVVGVYLKAGALHGFTSTAKGKSVVTIDFPGSTTTQANGINN